MGAASGRRVGLDEISVPIWNINRVAEHCILEMPLLGYENRKRVQSGRIGWK